METNEPLPLAERPLEELQLLLTELEADEASLIMLKEANPELDDVEYDDKLDAEKYKIWQSISRLNGVQMRIRKVKIAMEGKAS